MTSLLRHIWLEFAAAVSKDFGKLPDKNLLRDLLFVFIFIIN